MRPDEAKRLELLAKRAYFLIIVDTHYVGAQPVETCGITFPQRPARADLPNPRQRPRCFPPNPPGAHDLVRAWSATRPGARHRQQQQHPLSNARMLQQATIPVEVKHHEDLPGHRAQNRRALTPPALMTGLGSHRCAGASGGTRRATRPSHTQQKASISDASASSCWPMLTRCRSASSDAFV